MEIPFKSLFTTSKLPEQDILATTEDVTLVGTTDEASNTFPLDPQGQTVHPDGSFGTPVPEENYESEDTSELPIALVAANKLVDDIVYLYTQTGGAISLELQERIRAFKKMLD